MTPKLLLDIMKIANLDDMQKCYLYKWVKKFKKEGLLK
jgi:hypothetical protein